MYLSVYASLIQPAQMASDPWTFEMYRTDNETSYEVKVPFPKVSATYQSISLTVVYIYICHVFVYKSNWTCNLS